MSQLLIKGGLCVTAGATFQADILIDDGKITTIGRELAPTAGQAAVIDAHDRYILPGGIDVHVHLPWPTGSYVSMDSIESGTLAAAHGGVTTVLDFAIPREGQSLKGILDEKLSEAEGHSWVDYSCHLNIRPDIQDRILEIPELVKRGFPSFKVFMAYEGFRLDDADLLNVMEAVKRAGGMLNVHAENGLLADHLTSQLIEERKTAPCFYPSARPNICETEAIGRLLSYERMIGVRLHIHHVSTAKGAEQIRLARQEGLPVTGETCPHYLVFNSDDYSRDASQAAYKICAPSIKSVQDQSALWNFLAEGSLSILATDHCPYSKRQKEQHLDDFSKIPGGIGGVELRLPIVYSEGVLKGKLTMERFVGAWATEPAKAFGLYPHKGMIAVGSDADLVIFDPRSIKEIHAADLHMNTDCLPYESWKAAGLSLTTILRGNVIVEQGRLITQKPNGKVIPRYVRPNDTKTRKFHEQDIID